MIVHLENVENVSHFPITNGDFPVSHQQNHIDVLTLEWMRCPRVGRWGEIAEKRAESGSQLEGRRAVKKYPRAQGQPSCWGSLMD